MKRNVPLLPFWVGARVGRRQLPPFRLTLRGILVRVAVVAVLLAGARSFAAHMERLARGNNFHVQKAFSLNPQDPNHLWHAARYAEYHAALERWDRVGFAAAVGMAGVVVLWVAGRLLNLVPVRRDEAEGDDRP